MSDGTLIVGVLSAVVVIALTGFLYVYIWSQRKYNRMRGGGDGIAHARRPDYCDHIQREVKLTKQKTVLKEIESRLTKDQVEEERRIQRRQLEEIFRMMEEQKERFGIESVDDVKDQMKLYI